MLIYTLYAYVYLLYIIHLLLKLLDVRRALKNIFYVYRIVSPQYLRNLSFIILSIIFFFKDIAIRMIFCLCVTFLSLYYSVYMHINN